MAKKSTTPDKAPEKTQTKGAEKAAEKPAEKPAPAKRGVAVRKITVDYWKTKLHSAAIGIKKDIEYQAKSRQFTKEYEIKGQVYFNDDQKGDQITSQIIAVNTNDLNQKELERRLLIRTFTTLVGDSGGRFVGGIEHSMLESVQLSMSAEKPLSVLVVVIPDSDYLIRIFRKRRMIGDSYCFVLPPSEKDPNFHFIDFTGKMGAGNDFDIKEGDEIIGDINDKVLDIGGKFDITIKNENYQWSKDLHQIIVLFCCAMKYLKEIEGDVEKVLKMTDKKGSIAKLNMKPYADELDLFKNPRKYH